MVKLKSSDGDGFAWANIVLTLAIVSVPVLFGWGGFYVLTSHRIEQLERQQAGELAKRAELSVSINALAVAIGKLEQTHEYQVRTISRLERLLDDMYGPKSP